MLHTCKTMQKKEILLPRVCKRIKSQIWRLFFILLVVLKTTIFSRNACTQRGRASYALKEGSADNCCANSTSMGEKLRATRRLTSVLLAR